MTRTETSDAIGAITALLVQRLQAAIDEPPKTPGYSKVTLGLPRKDPGKNIYLTLYEMILDPALKNYSLDVEEPPPVWLELKYMLTAYSESDTDYDAYRYLGKAVRTLNDFTELDYFSTTLSWVGPALESNPEPLKITFDEAPLDLVSKILGDASEKFHCAICFQVRPIMITPMILPSHTLRIGIDSTLDPVVIIGEKGIKIAAKPIRLPFIDSINPTRIEFKEQEFTLSLKGVNLYQESVSEDNVVFQTYFSLGTYEQRIEPEFSVSPIELNWTLDAETIAGALSPGLYTLMILGKETKEGIERITLVSEGKSVYLDPYLEEAKIQRKNLAITGRMLGRKGDSILISFSEEGKTVAVYDGFKTTDDQSELIVDINNLDNLTGDRYRVILYVNGRRASSNPVVDF